ncbi:unnamed protein product, partial [Mesorhabditis spiculigera]
MLLFGGGLIGIFVVMDWLLAEIEPQPMPSSEEPDEADGSGKDDVPSTSSALDIEEDGADVDSDVFEYMDSPPPYSPSEAWRDETAAVRPRCVFFLRRALTPRFEEGDPHGDRLHPIHREIEYDAEKLEQGLFKDAGNHEDYMTSVLEKISTSTGGQETAGQAWNELLRVEGVGPANQ